MKKDLRLLRPFDPEAAKRGELLCDLGGVLGWKYVSGPDAVGNIVTLNIGTETLVPPVKSDEFRMAPLTWVEGKPVYKGDVLFHHKMYRTGRYTFTAEGFKDGKLRLKSDPEAYLVARPERLTWTPPVQKKTGWIVCTRNMGALSEEEAKSIAAAHPELLALHVNWEA